MNDYKLLINGERVEGAARMDVIDPATGEPFASCPRADAAQAGKAVAAAKAAFPAWAALSIADRKACLLNIADAMQAKHHEMAVLLTREQGKPLAQALHEVGGGFTAFRAFADMDLPIKTLSEDDDRLILEHRTPLGVVAAITPWNFPIILLMVKVAPALLAGNTVVIKPAPTTPLTSLMFAEIVADLLPAGVVNVITDQNDLGALLTAHPDVAKIAFTGSTETGRQVMQSAAGTLKRFTLELGGNDAAIVLDDMNPKEAAQKLFNAAMVNAGQVCLATKRAYVPTALYDAVCDELATLARAAKVGSGLTADTTIGPLQNKQQYEKVKGFLADAHANGTVISGGAALDQPGYFIAPTIVRDVAENSRIVREEQFGPILPVLKYDDIDEAIRRVNESEYGLGGTVWGRDIARATAVALRINSGTAWVNTHLELPFNMPFGGAKQSGIGREQGQPGLEEYTQAHSVMVAKTP